MLALGLRLGKTVLKIEDDQGNEIFLRAYKRLDGKIKIAIDAPKRFSITRIEPDKEIQNDAIKD